MIDTQLLKNEEKTVYELRALYSKYGYLPYRMSKFEEYELYIRNKEFMVSDRVIAFNDTNGKLLALKPDVTLSIIKSGEDIKGQKQKVYYNENVYRVSETTHRFKEIMQAGLECIGDIDLYDVFEVISLAQKSLMQISGDYVLEISNLDIVSKVLGAISGDKAFAEEAIKYISEKNTHDLEKLCEKHQIGKENFERIKLLITSYGDRSRVIESLKEICVGAELEEMESLSKMLDTLPQNERIIFDFSVMNNLSYYNGFTFRGFVSGISGGVLSGGCYGKMMQKMNRKTGAVGFALYLDMLDKLEQDANEYDVEYVVLYDDTVESISVAERVNSLIAQGATVSAQKSLPEKLRYKELVDMTKEAQ